MMSDKKEINNFIKERIRQRISKSQIENELASKYKYEEYARILMDYPEPALKQKYSWLNTILISCLVIVTLFKVLSILGLGAVFGPIGVSLFLILGLALNVFLIVYLLSYRASAYLATLTFTILSITKSVEGTDQIFASGDNLLIGTAIFQFVLIGFIILLSIVLWKKVHPHYSISLKKK